MIEIAKSGIRLSALLILTKQARENHENVYLIIHILGRIREFPILINFASLIIKLHRCFITEVTDWNRGNEEKKKTDPKIFSFIQIPTN